MSIQFNTAFWVLLGFLAGCTGQSPQNDLALPVASSSEDYLVSIKTPYGTMKAILYEETPIHKANFIKLIREGFYQDLLFHRVIPEFMVQGGDPSSRNASPGAKLGQGDPGYSLPAEILPQFFHKKGALAAARKGDQVNPDRKSNGSQFYIVEGKKFTLPELKAQRIDYPVLYNYFQKLMGNEENASLREAYLQAQSRQDEQALMDILVSAKETIEEKFAVELDLPLSEAQIQAYTQQGGFPSIDGQYTIFGQVVEGLEVISQITKQPKDPANRPLEDLPMQLSLEVLPKEEIMQKYGYSYPN